MVLERRNETKLGQKLADRCIKNKQFSQKNEGKDFFF
jgi:hypothetical protein